MSDPLPKVEGLEMIDVLALLLWEKGWDEGVILKFTSNMFTSFVHDKTFPAAAQTFLSVSVRAGFRRQTQIRMSVPLKSDFIHF